jgi:hypothetical protein
VSTEAYEHGCLGIKFVEEGDGVIFEFAIRIFFIGIVGGGIQGPLGTATTNGLLCQPRVTMVMEKLVE